MKYYIFFLILILIIGAFTRFYQLDVLPNGLHPDEAANGLDIIRMIDDHDFRVFYNTNGPREALFFYLQGIFVILGIFFNIPGLGFTSLSLRIAPALIGIFTIFGTYLLVKQWFGRNYGLLASLFMAISAWHIQFSRNGFRAIMVPFILVFLFYFLTKTIQEKKLKYFILSAIFFSLGFYTYLSYLMILPLGFFFILFLLILKRIEFKIFLKNNIKKILIACFFAFIVYSPLLFHFFKTPADFSQRAGATSIFNPEFGNPLQLFIKNIIEAPLMFIIKGDTNFRHNYGSLPMLDPFLGTFFIIGIFIVLSKLNKPLYFFLFLWFGFMLAPTILSAESTPHSLRSVGTIPVAYIFSVIGIKFFYESFVKYNRKKFAIIFLVLIISLAFIFNITKYFVWWKNDPSTYRAYDYDISNMAKFMKDYQSSDIEKYAIIFGYSNHSLAFLTHDSKNHPIEGLYGIKGNYHVIDQLEKLETITPKTGKYIFVIQEDLLRDAIPFLQKNFPNGNFGKKQGFFYYTNIEIKNVDQ